MAVIIFYRSPALPFALPAGIECFWLSKKMKTYQFLLENLWTTAWWRLMFYEWSQLRCSSIRHHWGWNGGNSATQGQFRYIPSKKGVRSITQDNLYWESMTVGRLQITWTIPLYSRTHCFVIIWTLETLTPLFFPYLLDSNCALFTDGCESNEGIFVRASKYIFLVDFRFRVQMFGECFELFYLQESKYRFRVKRIGGWCVFALSLKIKLFEKLNSLRAFRYVI